FFEKVDGIFGCLFEEKKENDEDAEIEALLAERTEARKAKNFKRSDEIRDTLAARGIIIEDTPQGPRWKRAL
ncbi:MAG: cysteine--tRNA ligase, partial [Synergistes sp.]|nr:cysteine--tRNA ligase [Synergistes sp.]